MLQNIMLCLFCTYRVNGAPLTQIARQYRKCTRTYVFLENYFYFLATSKRVGMCRQILLKIPNMRCHKNLPDGSRDLPCGQTGRRMEWQGQQSLFAPRSPKPKITERDIFLNPQMNGIMIFDVVSCLRGAYKTVRWNENQGHSVLTIYVYMLYCFMFSKC